MSMLFGAMLQTPIRIDGSIPLWSVIALVIGGIATSIGIVIAMREQAAILKVEVKANKELDTLRFGAYDERFDTITALIAALRKELREDIAALREGITYNDRNAHPEP